MIITGDSLEVLKTLPDNSVDTVITDPPYGYSFMGKDWDKAVPSVEIWQECLRVLKPGAFACVMSAPRSDVQNAMISRLMEAGFRLDFTPIYWTYASGFPKAGNVGKLVDKRLGAERETIRVKPRPETSGTMAGASDTRPWIEKSRELGYHEVAGKIAVTDEAKALDGSYAGFQPKPAVEVVIIAMKPLSEKTYVDQALKNRKGITWLDDCRVPTSENLNGGMYSGGEMPEGVWKEGSGFSRQPKEAFVQPSGRFPANLLVSDEALNGHSKYFDLDVWAETLPFLAVPKASKSEKNKGLEHFPDRASEVEYGNIGRAISVEKRREEQDGKNAATMKNHHPTVKPLKLMSYLITLFSREGDTVLDPFVGSGTAVVAAEQLGRNGIGIEREAEYAEIARARVEHAKTEDDTNKQIQIIE